MSLDGLRAWIGEVERKLGMRTRVFLVLVAIAVGGAGAAIYLAIDARDSAVSESDVRDLQTELEARIGAGDAADLTQLEAEVAALKAQVEGLGSDSGKADRAKGKDASGGGAGASAGGVSAGKLPDLIEKAKEENEKAE
jgi:Skp family chaperone for outer membrane proteins